MLFKRLKVSINSGSDIVKAIIRKNKDKEVRMRAVVQRVKESSVTVNNQIISRIGPGLLVLLGVSEADDAKDVDYSFGEDSSLADF